MIIVLAVWTFLRALLGHSSAVALENIALRHQLMVLQRSVARPRLRRRDRVLWVCLAWLWPSWRASLVLVRPATVVAWHRQGFQLYWRWKSRLRSPGRPPIDREIRSLIRRMAQDNPTWGRRRIQAELHFLGYEIAALTVAKYMSRPSRRPSPTWRAFLAAHRHEIAAVDFFEERGLAFIVAVNEFDGSHRYDPEEVRAAIDLDPEIPVVRCDARISASGVQTLLTLVKHLIAHAPAAPQPSRGAHM